MCRWVTFIAMTLTIINSFDNDERSMIPWIQRKKWEQCRTIMTKWLWKQHTLGSKAVYNCPINLVAIQQRYCCIYGCTTERRRYNEKPLARSWVSSTDTGRPYCPLLQPKWPSPRVLEFSMSSEYFKLAKTGACICRSAWTLRVHFVSRLLFLIFPFFPPNTLFFRTLVVSWVSYCSCHCWFLFFLSSSILSIHFSITLWHISSSPFLSLLFSHFPYLMFLLHPASIVSPFLSFLLSFPRIFSLALISQAFGGSSGCRSWSHSRKMEGNWAAKRRERKKKIKVCLFVCL